MSTDIQHEEVAQDEDVALISERLVDKNREAYEALSDYKQSEDPALKKDEVLSL